MAYELTFEKLYPEGERYTGVADRFEGNFTGISGIRVEAIAAKIVEFFPPKGADKLIRTRIWVDISPFWTDLYKIEVIAHGSPIWWTGIIIALIIVGLAVITWKVTDIDWKAATPALIGLGIGLVLLVLAVMFGRPKRR